MYHRKKDGTLDMRYKINKLHAELTGDYEGNLLKNNSDDDFSFSSANSEPYRRRNPSNPLISKRQRSDQYKSRQLPIDSEGNVNFDFMASSSHSSDYPTSVSSFRFRKEKALPDNNPFTKSSGPSAFSNDSKAFSISPSSLSAKSRSSFKLRTNSANASYSGNKNPQNDGSFKFKFASRPKKDDQEKINDDSKNLLFKKDGGDRQGKATLTFRSTSDSIVSSSSNFSEPKLLTDYEIKFNKDGTVSRDSRAVKNGDIYFKNDGSIDRRCNAYKQRKIILDSNDQIDRFRMNLKLPVDQSHSSNFSFLSQNDSFSSNEPSSSSKSPYSNRPKDIKLKPPIQSSNAQKSDASKLRNSPFESDSYDDEYSEEPRSINSKNKSNEKPKLKLKSIETIEKPKSISKSIETIDNNETSSQPVKRQKSLPKQSYTLKKRTKSSTSINYNSIVNKVSKNKFKNDKDSSSDEDYNDDDSDDNNDNDYEQSVKTRETSIYEKENSKKTHKENKKNKSKELKLDTTIIYLIAIICLFVLYFIVLSFIPIANERNYLIKCPKNAFCDVKIEGNKSIKYTINRCEEKFIKLENGFFQICVPSKSTQLDEYLDTLKAASYIAQIDGNCLSQHEKIDSSHIVNLFPKADVSLFSTNNDFLTKFNGEEFESIVPQYNLMCRIYKNSVESMPSQTFLIVSIVIAALFITLKYPLFDNE